MEDFRNKTKKGQRILSKDLIDKIPYEIWDKYLNYNDLRNCVNILCIPLKDMTRKESLTKLSEYQFVSRKALKALNPDAFKVSKPHHQHISNCWTAERMQKLLIKHNLDVPISSIESTVQLYSFQIHEIQEILELNE